MLWMRCGNCRGEVGVPEDVNGTVSCPACGKVLFSRDAQTNVVWKKEPPAPAWMSPFGKLFTFFGVIAFGFSAYNEYNRPYSNDPVAAAISGALNPVFFICFPLGMYWLKRTGAFRDQDDAEPKKTA
jgi:hypothetical protein